MLFKWQTILGSSIPSLVPRPSHRPVFDRLQVCKNGGGRPGIIYHVNYVSVYLGRQRSPRWKRRILRMCSLFWTMSDMLFHFANVRNSSAWGRNYKIMSNPHPFLHTASDQKLDGGKAWEWDYSISTCTCFLSKTLDLWEAGTILYEVCTNYMYKEKMV